MCSSWSSPCSSKIVYAKTWFSMTDIQLVEYFFSGIFQWIACLCSACRLHLVLPYFCIIHRIDLHEIGPSYICCYYKNAIKFTLYFFFAMECYWCMKLWMLFTLSQQMQKWQKWYKRRFCIRFATICGQQFLFTCKFDWFSCIWLFLSATINSIWNHWNYFGNCDLSSKQKSEQQSLSLVGKCIC